jgi:hypothetical protein
MKSAAGTTPAAFGRNSDLLDQVDYRLAETPEERMRFIGFATGPIYVRARSSPRAISA